jgi:hypothetical protein
MHARDGQGNFKKLKFLKFFPHEMMYKKLKDNTLEREGQHGWRKISISAVNVR